MLFPFVGIRVTDSRSMSHDTSCPLHREVANEGRREMRLVLRGWGRKCGRRSGACGPLWQERVR